MTTELKEEYSKADVAGIIEVEKTNLDNLLTEELKVVRDNQKLQVDLALLEIADNNTPMAKTYTDDAINRLKELGFIGGFKQVRSFLLEKVDLSVGNREMEAHRTNIKDLVGQLPPVCQPGNPLPPTIIFPKTLDKNDLEGAENFYRLYREECLKVQELGKYPEDGQIKKAWDNWQSAKQNVIEMGQSIAEVEKVLAEKKAAFDQADKAHEDAKGKGPEQEELLKEKVGKLKKDLEAVQEFANFVGAKNLAEKRLNAIVTLLTAAAGEEINAQDQKLNQAANVVKEIPSLAGDIKGLLEQAQAPSVNNLLIEMRHQVLLLEYAKKRETLAQQRADILKTKYEALKAEPRKWLKFGDAICSYAVLSGNGPFPGQRCDNFIVKFENDKWVCTVPNPGSNETIEIEPCALEKPWNENINSAAGSASRELYKALAAYLQALAIQSKPVEQDFREIDVLHRETLASRESAIRGWDNLVAVPINQLDAYYQAGLKPAEIMDLLVKALGFTAITVGVAQ